MSEPEDTRLLGVDEIDAARSSIEGTARRTPLLLSSSISRRVDRPVWLKHEEMQRTGSFKIRGAYHRLRQLDRGGEVVCGSAGNHAQGVALAAKLLGLRASVFMPEGASLAKVAATRAYGASVHLGGATVDDAIASARGHAQRTGAVFVPPFDDRRIMAGQATIGWEILDDLPEVETVAVAIGGGGLCGGIAAAVKLCDPRVRVVGVAAGGAASIVASLDCGRPVAVTPATIADGIALRSPSPLTLAHISEFVDEVVVVSDDDITSAMVLLLERAKSVVEPAGAAPLAAVLGGLIGGKGPVVPVLGGGNVDPLALSGFIQHGLGRAGRFLVVSVRTADRPGSLARLTTCLADLGVNILAVEHRRSGLRMSIGLVEIDLTVETRGPEHRMEVIERLGVEGFEVTVVE